MTAPVFGWDVGGAHLKFVALAPDGAVLDIRELACPLWRGIDTLHAALDDLARDFPLTEAAHAITMTGELCDAFESRAQGVSAILDVLENRLCGTLRVYATRGWYSPGAARARHAEVASMNWHATAAYVARTLGDATLVDIGSTTTDLVPIRDGLVAARGYTDAARLAEGELVYTGIARTPVMAVVRQVPFLGRWHGVAAEYFANMADVYRVTEELPRDGDLHPTADQRAADGPHSLRRLARMVGADGTVTEVPALIGCAKYIRGRQLAQIDDALSLLASRSDAGQAGATLVGAGIGLFLVERLATARGANFLEFAALAGVPSEFAAAANAAAPALALARLLSEEAR